MEYLNQQEAKSTPFFFKILLHTISIAKLLISTKSMLSWSFKATGQTLAACDLWFLQAVQSFKILLLFVLFFKALVRVLSHKANES